MVEDQKKLGPAADGEAVHCRDPGLLDGHGPPGGGLASTQPSEDLVEVTELAPQEEGDQGDAAAVQDLEVEAGAEHPPATVAGIGHLPPAHQAQHARLVRPLKVLRY